MNNRFDYHFEPSYGWINDPNGVCQYKGNYHAFFQHNPFSTKWDKMYWGHAVSKDLIHWNQLANALNPDMFYENKGGCYSGSAIEKDGVLYLFYTSVSEELGQTQSVAFSYDGLHFEKYKNNPVILHNGELDDRNFRDPKVFAFNNRYYMVVGAELDGKGRILLFASDDLFGWDFVNIIYETAEFGGVLECPDLFELDGKWVLMFSAVKPTVASTVFVIGEFDGENFKAENVCYSEIGKDFYAPQTFLDNQGRRIMHAWFYSWGRKALEGATTAGALAVPRELHVKNGRIVNYPVKEAQAFLQKEHACVAVDKTKITIFIEGNGTSEYDVLKAGVEEIRDIEILFDKKAVEVFVNHGEASVSVLLY